MALKRMPFVEPHGADATERTWTMIVVRWAIGRAAVASTAI
jgi:hypothetical protein